MAHNHHLEPTDALLDTASSHIIFHWYSPLLCPLSHRLSAPSNALLGPAPKTLVCTTGLVVLVLLSLTLASDAF
jgi:hypothetical protein